ncbi:glucose 1-dehydrogenase [Nocardia wallacei]|uniref:glucose 1-dehydrogenase n=1 Tax=Nocardia wallacei TaxID=480035 RepID=UPI0024537EA9|nr:glucose 1-dehydrogenase [Nocardia wallacei]
MSPLRDKVALVTGGSRGIGRAIVHRLARDGAAVMFSYERNEQAADKVVAEVQEFGGRAVAVRADQGSLADVERLVAAAVEQFDGLDILVNNAGIAPRELVTELTEEQVDRAIAVNMKGPMFAMRHAGQILRDGGRIVNISTLNTILPVPTLAAYTATKAALEQLSKIAARELGSRGITVNTVSPAATDTELLRETNTQEGLDLAVSMTALGRLGDPTDIADVVAFLAGPDSRWITGQNLLATGGFAV